MHKAESAAGVTLLPVSEAAAPSRHTPARCWHPSLLREPWMELGSQLPPLVLSAGGSAPRARLGASLMQPHGFWPGATCIWPGKN